VLVLGLLALLERVFHCFNHSHGAVTAVSAFGPFLKMNQNVDRNTTKKSTKWNPTLSRSDSWAISF
jgi:hypothetical protein